MQWNNEYFAAGNCRAGVIFTDFPVEVCSLMEIPIDSEYQLFPISVIDLLFDDIKDLFAINHFWVLFHRFFDVWYV